jgi:hypothetical protein
MEHAWVFDRLAVTVAAVDFVDPAVAGEPDARERGVRLEIRPVEIVADGSVYVSPTVTMRPAVCRIDLLESRPGAADRMHWHPSMSAGEPGDRVFDPAIPADPTGWLRDRLHRVDALLGETAVDGGPPHSADVAGIATRADAIVEAVRAALDSVRTPWPWPEVARDSRGMATL